MNNSTIVVVPDCGADHVVQSGYFKDAEGLICDRPASTMSKRGVTPAAVGGLTWGHGHIHDLVEAFLL